MSTQPTTSESTTDIPGVVSSASFCLQAKDAFNEWETVYSFPTREQAEKMKEKREAEPVICCPVHWRIIEQNAEVRDASPHATNNSEG